VTIEERAVAFSVATIDSGRLFGRSEVCEVGRRCHERGERAAGAVVEGDVRVVTLDRLVSESNIGSFSLVGDVE
jgi:hypothetical protein